MCRKFAVFYGTIFSTNAVGRFQRFVVRSAFVKKFVLALQ